MAKKKVIDENNNINVTGQQEGVAVDATEQSTIAEADVAKQPIIAAVDVAEQQMSVVVDRKGIVNCDDLRLRDAPNLNSNIIKLLPKGSELIIIENTNSEFYKVVDGYVMKRFVDEK